MTVAQPVISERRRRTPPLCFCSCRKVPCLRRRDSRARRGDKPPPARQRLQTACGIAVSIPCRPAACAAFPWEARRSFLELLLAEFLLEEGDRLVNGPSQLFARPTMAFILHRHELCVDAGLLQLLRHLFRVVDIHELIPVAVKEQKWTGILGHIFKRRAFPILVALVLISSA